MKGMRGSSARQRLANRGGTEGWGRCGDQGGVGEEWYRETSRGRESVKDIEHGSGGGEYRGRDGQNEAKDYVRDRVSEKKKRQQDTSEDRGKNSEIGRETRKKDREEGGEREGGGR